MKKKVFLVSLIAVLLIAGLFVLTGCKNNNEAGEGDKNTKQAEVIVDGVKLDLNKEGTLKNLKFKYSENMKTTNEEENHIVMKLFKDSNDESALASVVLTYRAGENVEEYIKWMRKVEADTLESVTINGTKWYIYEYTSSNTTAHVYYGQNGQDTYVISFPQEGEDQKNIDIESFKTVFMNNTRFE